MTPAQRDYQLERVVEAMFGDGRGNPGLVDKVDRIDSRLDRWDGAFKVLVGIASFMGISGLALIVRALAT